MADAKQTIKARMKEIEDAIDEVKGRLPAHSVKPTIMHQLLDLEDEYDTLLNKLNQISAEDDSKSA